MSLAYIAYIVGCLLLILLFLRFAENKGFMTLILFWLFSVPVLANPKYWITIQGLGIDLQPTRLLFLVLTPFFLWTTIKKFNLNIFRNQPFIPKLNFFEACMLAYVGMNILAIMINNDQIGIRTALKESTDLVAFPLVFFAAKRYVSQKDFYLLSKALLIFAIGSAIVGVYQFFINPDFFRVGSLRVAFGSYFRANGFFSEEYYLGLFLVTVFIVAWEAFPNTMLRVINTTILALGVFVTMHRLSWIAMILFVGMALFMTIRKNLRFIFGGALIISILGLSVMAGLFSKPLSSSFFRNLLTQRVTDDTLTVRITLADFGLKMAGKYPFGIGDIWTPLYNQEAYTSGMPFNENGAYAIHDGFISASVRVGILGFVAFILYFLSGLFFFVKNSKFFAKQWYLPVAILLVYALFNFTNDFSNWGTEINILLALLMGSFTGQVERRVNITETAKTVEQYHGSLVYHVGGL